MVYQTQRLFFLFSSLCSGEFPQSCNFNPKKKEALVALQTYFFLATSVPTKTKQTIINKATNLEM